MFKQPASGNLKKEKKAVAIIFKHFLSTCTLTFTDNIKTRPTIVLQQSFQQQQER